MTQHGKSIWFKPIGGIPWWVWVVVLLIIGYVIWKA